MSACTFFGHRDCPDSIRQSLREAIIDLIENHDVDMFYVGRQGAFDAIARNVLKELTGAYPHSSYAVVLEHLPQNGMEVNGLDSSETMLPEGIEAVHPRFAIVWRNKWMIRQSDYVITCVTHSWGGAAQFAEMAKQQKKLVIGIVP